MGHTSFRLFVAAALCGASLGVAAQGTDALVTCGSAIQNLPAAISSLGTGASQATMVVQFNVHRPPSGASIFVDDNNHGICEIEIRNGKRIIGNPHWSFDGEDPKGAFSKVGISAKKRQQNGNEVAAYDVTAGTAPKNSTVRIKFYVEFQ